LPCAGCGDAFPDQARLKASPLRAMLGTVRCGQYGQGRSRRARWLSSLSIHARDAVSLAQEKRWATSRLTCVESRQCTLQPASSGKVSPRVMVERFAHPYTVHGKYPAGIRWADPRLPCAGFGGALCCRYALKGSYLRAMAERFAHPRKGYGTSRAEKSIDRPAIALRGVRWRSLRRVLAGRVLPSRDDREIIEFWQERTLACLMK